jgi:hypothetical protein
MNEYDKWYLDQQLKNGMISNDEYTKIMEGELSCLQ